MPITTTKPSNKYRYFYQSRRFSLHPLTCTERRSDLVCYDYAVALFTGKGDQGTTKLFDTQSGVRVSKASPIFETLGMLDELNTLVGWCKVETRNKKQETKTKRETQNSSEDIYSFNGRSFYEILHEVQDYLFTIQAEVAGAGKVVPPEATEALSAVINEIEKEMPPIKTFLVPGGTELSARLDVTRAVSRRAERRLVNLHESGDRIISESSRAYANRLSSLFYALTRLANHRAGISETPPSYRDT